MAWTPNPTPSYAVGPFATLPTLLPTVAADGTTGKAAKIYSANGNNRPAFSLISLLPVGALSAGKFILYTSTSQGGSTLVEVDEIVNASQSGYSTTASGTLLTFTRWSSATPLILPETADVYVGSAVAQSTPPMAYGYGKLY